MTTTSVNLDTIKRLASFAANRSREDRIAQVAGSLTFTTVLSVVPLVTVAFALFTAFPIFASFRDSLQGFLVNHLMPPAVNNQIFKYLNQFSSKAKGLTTAGMLVLGMTSVMTMMTVESVLNVIWRVRKRRPLAQRVLVYWAILTLGPVLFGISLSISSYLWTESISSVGVVLHGVSKIARWLLSLTVIPLSAIGFTIIYVYLPNCRVEWRDALIGGAFAAVAFELTKRGFGLYIRHFPAYTMVYGAFAAIPIFLLWVYLSWCITLLGAMLVSALPAIRAGQHRRPHFAGSELLDALGVLSQLVLARDQGQVGMTVFDLARRLGLDIGVARHLLEVLETHHWVAHLQSDRNIERWVLIANPEQITVASLFDVFVINRRELAYQIELASSRIDGEMLLAALGNERLSISLTQLIEARAVRHSSGVVAA